MDETNAILTQILNVLNDIRNALYLLMDYLESVRQDRWAEPRAVSEAAKRVWLYHMRLGIPYGDDP